MRVNLCILLGVALSISTPALAGTVVVADGKLAWQSNQCTAPEVPASLSSPENHHAAAEIVNKHMAAYNGYVQKAQEYMDCLSQEAQGDAKIASDSVTASAQQKIDDTRKSVADLGAPLQPRK